MSINWKTQIESLFKKNYKIYIAAAGCGAGAIDRLMQVPGASNTLVGAQIIYHPNSMKMFLGKDVQHFCHQETSLDLANEAYTRAVVCTVNNKEGKEISDEDLGNIVGIGITAVVATNRIVKGGYRAYLTVRIEKHALGAAIQFQTDEFGLPTVSREHHLTTLDNVILSAIFVHAGIEQVTFPCDCLTGPTHHPEVTGKDILYLPDGQMVNIVDPKDCIFYPGSFNPLHDGHRRIAELVEHQFGKPVIFMINRTHPDKGSIEYVDFVKRVSQFKWYKPVVTTEGLDLFLDKAMRYPNSTFIVGTDTLARILNPKYYSILLKDILAIFYESNLKFIVIKRASCPSTEILLREFYDDYKDMFTEVDANFPESSTELRNKS